MNKRKIRHSLLWILLAVILVLLVFFKFSLTGRQMAEVYFSSYAPIDDTLMYDSAVSIVEGNWLGDYTWKTMSKHMFFSVWLAGLSKLGIPYLVGGQLLYLVACIAAAAAVIPLFKRKWGSAVVFALLCLLFFAGVIGMAVRFKDKPYKSIPFAIAAGLGLGTAWLTREDGVWLLPFAICAAIAYLAIVLMQKERLVSGLKHALMPAVALTVCFACVGLYCFKNYRFYDRFVISDFTSWEFNDAVGALLRCETDGAHDKKILVCKETRDKVAAAVPLYAEIEKVIEENPALYGGYGYPEQQEFNSGGFCWALRIAVSEAGYYKDAVTARDFYAELADEINKACDSGALTHDGGKKSTTLMPWQREFLKPTIAEVGSSFGCLLGFEQTSSLAALSTAPEEQANQMAQFLHQEVSSMVNPDTGQAMYSPEQRDVEIKLRAISGVYRVIIPCALIMALVVLCLDIAKAIREIAAKKIGVAAMRAVMVLGVALSILLRIGIVSYIEAASFQIGTYLLYLSSAGPLILLFAAYGIVGVSELVYDAISAQLQKKFALVKQDKATDEIPTN
ncbi:MAG: hypothetical protein RRZ42_00710 [Oscillospiraceae bacterium]